jgi:HAD superfamily phosphoserine phosphatase-like hydrolase
MTQFAGRPYAVFDIDGTLYRWQLFHELVQELTFVDVFPDDVFHTVNERWNLWRGGNINFDDYEQSIVTTLEQYLPEIPVPIYLATCEKVVAQSKHKTYHYTRNLIQQLKKENYVIIAISGSQQELLDTFGAHYGFDIVIGAIYERDGDRFTGKMTRQTVGRKAEILVDLIKEHQLIDEGSLAIGDGDGDATILELVERPIAFNPAEGLFERAKRDGWSIVIERKNIAYRLEKVHNALVLAETITY